MDEQMKSRLTSKDVWLRGLYMIFFAIAWGLSEVLLVFTVLFQFFRVLFTGSANQPLLRFGQNLSRYHYQMAQFVSFNTETRPFPFSDWPDDAAGGERWMDDGNTPEVAESPADTPSAAPEPVPAETDSGGSDQDVAAESSGDADVSASRKDEVPPSA